MATIKTKVSRVVTKASPKEVNTKKGIKIKIIRIIHIKIRIIKMLGIMLVLMDMIIRCSEEAIKGREEDAVDTEVTEVDLEAVEVEDIDINWHI